MQLALIVGAHDEGDLAITGKWEQQATDLGIPSPIAHADWRKQWLASFNHLSIVLSDNGPQIERCQIIDETAGEIASVNAGQCGAEQPELNAILSCDQRNGEVGRPSRHDIQCEVFPVGKRTRTVDFEPKV